MNKELGYKNKINDKNNVKIKRTTRESIVEVNVELSKRRDFKLETGIDFFNHMIETIAWRACMNIDAEYKNTQFRLTHVITEDVGIVMGKVFRQLLENKMKEGINGNGTSIGLMEEAMANIGISFEGRCTTFIDIKRSKGAKRLQVEDMLSDDLIEFFKGFSQGAGATVSIIVLSGENPHHTWEAVFRGFGECIKKCFEPNSWRIGTTTGVKGTLD
jgi:imidazoleglycerol-phosphate dehydratase